MTWIGKVTEITAEQKCNSRAAPNWRQKYQSKMYAGLPIFASYLDVSNWHAQRGRTMTLQAGDLVYRMIR